MFKKVVWATDASEAADQTLAFARQFATEDGGQLLAVHVVELTTPGKDPGGRYPVYANEDELKAEVERVAARQRDAAIAPHRALSSARRADPRSPR